MRVCSELFGSDKILTFLRYYIWLTNLPPYETMILIVDLDYLDEGML